MVTPTLYDWIGGIEPLKRLTNEFYRRVPEDELLGPVFAGMNADHPEHVALFLGEVMGGPPFTASATAVIRKWSGITWANT